MAPAPPIIDYMAPKYQSLGKFRHELKRMVSALNAKLLMKRKCSVPAFLHFMNDHHIKYNENGERYDFAKLIYAHFKMDGSKDLNDYQRLRKQVNASRCKKSREKKETPPAAATRSNRKKKVVEESEESESESEESEEEESEQEEEEEEQEKEQEQKQEEQKQEEPKQETPTEVYTTIYEQLVPKVFSEDEVHQTKELCMLSEIFSHPLKVVTQSALDTAILAAAEMYKITIARMNPPEPAAVLAPVFLPRFETASPSEEEMHDYPGDLGYDEMQALRNLEEFVQTSAPTPISHVQEEYIPEPSATPPPSFSEESHTPVRTVLDTYVPSTVPCIPESMRIVSSPYPKRRVEREEEEVEEEEETDEMNSYDEPVHSVPGPRAGKRMYYPTPTVNPVSSGGILVGPESGNRIYYPPGFLVKETAPVVTSSPKRAKTMYQKDWTPKEYEAWLLQELGI